MPAYNISYAVVLYHSQQAPAKKHVTFTSKLSLVFQEKSACDLIKTWYKLDQNAVEEEYVLQPISSQFPGFAQETGMEDLSGISDAKDHIIHAVPFCHHDKKTC